MLLCCVPLQVLLCRGCVVLCTPPHSPTHPFSITSEMRRASSCKLSGSVASSSAKQQRPHPVRCTQLVGSKGMSGSIQAGNAFISQMLGQGRGGGELCVLLCADVPVCLCTVCLLTSSPGPPAQ